MSSQPGLYQFGGYCLDVPERRLTLEGQPVPLPDKSFEVLHLLVQNAGKLVGKDELMGKLWPEAFVEESNLAKHISILRKALENGQSGKEYIETVPKRGYRFIAPVSASEGKSKTTVGQSGHNLIADVPLIPAGRDQRVTDQLPPANPWTPSVSLPLHTWQLVGIASLLLCMVIIAVTTYQRTRPPLGDANADYKLLGTLTDSGRVRDLAISPDGRYVAYLQQERSGVALRLRHVQTRSDIEILPPRYIAFGGVTFSPDNAYLYFVRGDIESPVKSLYRLPVLGGSAQKLRDGVDSAVAFSPDGKQIAFEQHSLSSGMVLEVATLDGSIERTLAQFPDAVPQLFFYGPAWSPNGQTIAVSFKRNKSPEKWILATVSAADGRAQELYANSNAIGRPSWLASGSALVIPRNDTNDHGQLWMVTFPGGTPRQLIHDLGDYWYPLSVSQDSRTLAAIAMTGVVSNLWMADAEALDKGHQISSGLPLYLVLHAPDGNTLAISDDGQLWVAGANGDRRPILSELPMKSQPARCAARIVLTSYRGGETTIVTADPDGSELRKLQSGRLRSPGCSPEGKDVYYMDLTKPERVLRQPEMGGTPQEVAKMLGESVAGKLSISPDGRFLAYAYRQRTDAKTLRWYLAIMSTTGRGRVTSIEVPQLAMGPKWSPDGKSLDFLLVRDGSMNLWRQSLHGAPPKQLTQFENSAISDFDWSVDGKRLLLARGSGNADVVLWTRQTP